MADSTSDESVTQDETPQSGTEPQQRKGKRLSRFLLRTLIALLLVAVVGSVYFFSRYAVSEETAVEVTEFPTFQYAGDPSGRSPYYSEYKGRRLKLVQLDETHFDFVFEPLEDHLAKIVFKNVDVSLMTPNIPEYVKADDGLRRVALTDREWNRQQVQFHVGTDAVEITGGDGFEKENLKVASLARNCLNAGLWELSPVHQNRKGQGDVLPRLVHVSDGAVQAVCGNKTRGFRIGMTITFTVWSIGSIQKGMCFRLKSFVHC